MKPLGRQRTWTLLGASAVLTGGLFAAAGPAAEASPRYHEWERARVVHHPRGDRDRDGIPNFRDPHPNRPDRYAYPVYPRGRDEDRDGVPNWRDRDRDGDGVPNWRDRFPNNRHRH